MQHKQFKKEKTIYLDEKNCKRTQNCLMWIFDLRNTYDGNKL